MADEALTPAEIQAAEELAKAQKELAWQLTSIGVNAATIVDPTGLTNIPAMGMSLYEGDFIGAGLSLIGLIPLAGKLSDVAKEARLAERLAVMGEKVAALTAKLKNARKEADVVREAARLAKAGKEIKEAEAAGKTAETAVKETEVLPKSPPSGCAECAKKAGGEGAKPPEIKPGSSGGATAKKKFPQQVKDAANKENPAKTCVYCRRPNTGTQVDHAIPRAKGGNATLDNAQLACPHCNASKGANEFPKTPPQGYEGPWPPPWW